MKRGKDIDGCRKEKDVGGCRKRGKKYYLWHHCPAEQNQVEQNVKNPHEILGSTSVRDLSGFPAIGDNVLGVLFNRLWWWGNLVREVDGWLFVKLSNFFAHS